MRITRLSTITTAGILAVVLMVGMVPAVSAAQEDIVSETEAQAAEKEFDAAAVDEVMRKYDRDSNVRIWTGWQKWTVYSILAAFAIFVIYVTLFATWLDLVRYPSFLGCVLYHSFVKIRFGKPCIAAHFGKVEAGEPGIVDGHGNILSWYFCTNHDYAS